MSALVEVAQAVAYGGRDVVVDHDAGTLDIEEGVHDAGTLFGVVREHARAVTFYSVHPTRVPPERWAHVRELLARVTATEFTVALELDHATGVVSTRAGVVLGTAELDQETLARLLAPVVDEVEEVGLRVREAVDAVAEGRIDGELGAAQVEGRRTAGLVAEMSEAVDHLEAIATRSTPES